MESNSFGDPPTNSKAFDLFAVIHALLKSPWGKDLKLVQLGPGAAVMESKKGTAFILLSGAEADLEPRLIEAARVAGASKGAVAIIGGPRSLQNFILDCRVSFTKRSLKVYHLRSFDELIVSPESSSGETPFGEALRAARALSDRERTQTFDTIKIHLEAAQIDRHERKQFQDSLEGRTPYATYGLLGTIGVMFALQNYFGLNNALSMGALSVAEVEQGEWWRLISVGFLHGSFLHALMNSFVLYILGTQLERVLGTRRFILLYTFALVGGSLGSLTHLGDHHSVGASGAVWGLLAAQASLAYGMPAILPSTLAKRMRSVAVQNLAINVFISFQANIDWAAHLGGGLAGGLLLASGALSAGLKKPSEVVEKAQGKQTQALPSAPWLSGAAMLCGLTLLSGIILAQANGKPWNLMGPVVMKRFFVAPVGLSVSLPQRASKQIEKEEKSGEYGVTFGNSGADMSFGRVVFFKQDGLETPERRVAVIQEILPQLVQPEEASTLSTPHEVRIHGQGIAQVKYAYPGGATLDIALLPLAGVLVRSEIFCREQDHPQCPTQKQVLDPLF